jgi:hypothetical protein
MDMKRSPRTRILILAAALFVLIVVWFLEGAPDLNTRILKSALFNRSPRSGSFHEREIGPVSSFYFG